MKLFFLSCIATMTTFAIINSCDDPDCKHKKHSQSAKL